MLQPKEGKKEYIKKKKVKERKTEEEFRKGKP